MVDLVQARFFRANRDRFNRGAFRIGSRRTLYAGDFAKAQV